MAAEMNWTTFIVRKWSIFNGRVKMIDAHVDQRRKRFDGPFFLMDTESEGFAGQRPEQVRYGDCDADRILRCELFFEAIQKVRRLHAA